MGILINFFNQFRAFPIKLASKTGSLGQSKLYQLVGVYYLFQFSISFQSLSFNAQMPSWELLIESERYFEALWPVFWIDATNYSQDVYFILIGFLISSLLASIFWKNNRLIRIISALFFFQYLALISSFGKIDHYLHLSLICSVLLIFLPWQSENNRNSIKAISVFWSIQVFILFTYTSSGFFKLFGLFDQLRKSEISALSPNSLALNSAKTIFQTDQAPFLSKFLMENPNYGFSLLLILGYIVEFSALAFAFLPQYQRAYGMTLMLFHLGILITVGPDFFYQFIVVGIFIFLSPYHGNRELTSSEENGHQGNY